MRGLGVVRAFGRGVVGLHQLQRADRADERMDKFDRRLEAMRKMIEAGMRMLAKRDKDDFALAG